MPHFQRNIRLLLFILLPIGSFLLGWGINERYNSPSARTENVSSESKSEWAKDAKNILQIVTQKGIDPKSVDLSSFWAVWETLNANYLKKDTLNTKDQVYGAIKGLVSSAKDPYTSFLDPKEAEEFEISLSSEFEGIGAIISVKNETIVVVSPLKGSPAEQAGIRSGDYILKINGESTHGMNSLQAATKIRGKKGTKVKLEINRPDLNKPLSLEIVRDTVQNQSVSSEVKDEMGIISINQFSTETFKEFKTAIEEVLSQNPKGLIVDLRNNGGGLLEVCISILDEFFDGGKKLVSTKGRKMENSDEFISSAGGKLLDIPVVVLVNKGSASASEIFAGAIIDHNRGILLGETTFGKGSVQNVIPFLDGSSLKVTIAEWFTPKGHQINGQGVTPHETIEDNLDPFSKQGKDAIKERAFQILKDEKLYNSLLQSSPKPIVKEKK